MVITKKIVARNAIMIRNNWQVTGEINKTKCLGVIVDNNINLKDYIKCIAGKVLRNIEMMIKATQYHHLQQEALLAFTSLIAIIFGEQHAFQISVN